MIRRLAAILFLLASGPVFADDLDRIAKVLSKPARTLSHPEVAVLPFPYHDGREGRGSTVVSERLTTRISGRGKLRVVERTLLQKVLQELKLQNTGAISQDSAKKLGGLLGVEAIVTGTLIDLGNGQIEINARLIQAETGLVLAAAGGTQPRDWPEEEKSSDPAASSKADMSTFFHTEKWQDPRFKEDPQAPSEPVVLGNSESDPVRGLGGERITDSPDELVEESGRTALRSDPRFRELQESWKAVQGEDSGAALSRLEALRDGYERQNAPRLAALSRVYRAEALFRSGRYDDAVEEARPAARLETYPRIQAQARYVIARSLEQSGRKEQAARLYEEIVRRHPFESRLIRAAGARRQAYSRR
jgi:TolB-like protein